MTHQPLHQKKAQVDKAPPQLTPPTPTPAPQSDPTLPFHLTQREVLRLQRTHGNQAVQRMIAQQAPRRIQRTGRFRRGAGKGEKYLGESGGLDLVATVGDYVGTDMVQGLSQISSTSGTGNALTGGGSKLGGAVIGTGAGIVGTGISGFTTGSNIHDWVKTDKELEQVKPGYKTGGDKELYATVALLERKREAAMKGTAEGVGGILGGISGTINGIAGFFSTVAAGAVAGVAFGVGAGLNALLGTIMAIRDFFSAHKRRMGQGAMGGVIDAYGSLFAPTTQKIQTVKNQWDALTLEKEQHEQDLLKIQLVVDQLRALPPQERKKIPLSRVQAISTRKADIEAELRTMPARLQALEDQQRDAEADFDKIDKMRIALATSKRKMGFKGKIGSGVAELVGAGGGAALLAATLGTSVTAAAATPVGWILSAVAIVAGLGYFIGMQVKRSLRKSNVIRMRSELDLVNEYINTGKISGVDVPGVSAKAEDRVSDMWSRDMFEGKTDSSGEVVGKKHWFGRAFDRRKSGTMTMQARKTELEKYLAKYDVQAAGDTIFEGFKAALADGAEGDQEVDNPKYDPKKPGGVAPKAKLRDVIEGLLEHFFPGKKDDMKASILSNDPAKNAKAKTLLMQKMKLSK